MAHHKLSADGSVETKNLIMGSGVESSYTSQIRNPTANHIEVRDVDSNGNAFVNRNGDSYIAYVFAQVEGYSAYGRYTAGAVSDTKIYLDFKPSVIGFKRVGVLLTGIHLTVILHLLLIILSTPRNVDTMWQPLDLTSAYTGMEAQQRYVQMDLDTFFQVQMFIRIIINIFTMHLLVICL